MNLNPSELIKTFLKVDSPKYIDKPYYSINNSKKIITLYDRNKKSPSDNSTDFEEDKIFTELDENSYIYENICRNSIKDVVLNGISYSFIFYGDTSSSKFNLSIGDIKEDNNNYNKYGIVLRYIDNIIKEANNDIKLKISYFLLHDNDIFDLTKLKNKNFDINNFTMNQLNKYKYTIKNDEKIINHIIKTDLEKMTKELNFLSNILNILFKLESKDDNNNILSRSYIGITIYIFNEQTKKNSVTNFLILNGCENLYYGLNQKFKLTANISNTKINEDNLNENLIEGSKISLEAQYTYETLLNLVKLELYKDINKTNLDKNDLNLLLSKKKQNSKLTNILNEIFSNISKIYFRIICTVTPSTGQYQNFKDSLLFLLDYKKLKIKCIKYSTKIEKKSKKNVKAKSIAVNDKTMQMLLEQKEDLLKKDNKIFILENDILGYKKEIKEAKKEINKRNEKIYFLEQAYTEQVNTLKNKLEFKGDINLLIAGDENSDEMKYVKNLKNIIELNKIRENDIKELEEKLIKKNEEIKHLKNEIEMLKSNQAMINYYLYAKNEKNKNIEKNQEYDDKIKLKNIIEGLEKEIKIKNKLIEKYKQEIDNKNKILINLPKVLKEKYTPVLSVNNKIVDNNEDKKDNSGDESLKTENIYESEIKNIKDECEKNFTKIRIEYENNMKLKNEDIKNLQYEYDKLKIEKNNDINKYTNEIVKMNKILMGLISNYKRIFFSNLTPKLNFMNYSTKIDEYNKIVISTNQEITFDKFPLLFEYLMKNKHININQPFLNKNVKKIYTPIMNDLEEKNNSKNIDILHNKKLNKNNNKTFIINKEKLESMSKEDLIKYILSINEYSKNNDKLNINEENIDEMTRDLMKKIEKLNNQLEEQIQRNNKNEVIIGAQNRKINRLEKESIITAFSVKNKRHNNISLLTPNRSTLYNSSAIDYNSNISENLTSNKNKFNKVIKKSNSCLTINKSKNKRPLSHKLNNFPENNRIRNYTTNKVLSRDFSNKLREFQMDRENKIINSLQDKN